MLVVCVFELICHSCSRNFDLILMKFCTVIWGSKNKIKFVWDKKSDNSFPYLTLPYLQVGQDLTPAQR